MNRFLLTGALLALPLLFAVNGTLPAFAHNASLPQEQNTFLLTEEEAKNFSKALSALASRGKVAFVVEATPLLPTLPTLPDDLPQDQSIKTLVPWLARTYDYTAEVKDGVWVLRKKYTDPADVPAVTLAECHQALGDMNSLLSAFSPNFKIQYTASRTYFDIAQTERKLVLSLSEEQLQKMHGAVRGDIVISPVPKEKALPIASLSTEQKDLLRKMVLYHYLQTPQYPVLSTLEEIDNVTRNGAAFVHRTPGADPLWGYESKNVSPRAIPNSYYFWAIDARSPQMYPTFNHKRLPPSFKAAASIDLSKRPRPGIVPVFVPPDWTSRVPKTPAKRPANTPLAWGEGAAATETLGSVAAAFNAKREKQEPEFQVDEALAAKPVTLVGETSASRETIFRSFATLYDLRIVHLPDQPIRLLRKAIPRVKSLSDVAPAVWQQYPAPLRRAFRIDPNPELDRKEAEEEAQLRKRLEASNGETLSEDDARVRTRIYDKRSGFTPQISKPVVAMAKYLHTTVKARSHAKADEPILLSDVFPQEEAAFATHLMAVTSRETYYFAAEGVPAYVDRFDEFYLCGFLGINGKNDKFWVTLAMPNADGINVGGGGPTFNGTLEPEYKGSPKSKP